VWDRSQARRRHDDRQNPSPLFVEMNGAVARRNSLGNARDYSWTPVWLGPETYAELKLLGMA